MYYALSALMGTIIAIMIVINGMLSLHYGLYASTVIIHIVGLLSVAPIAISRKASLIPAKKQPYYIYLGGVIGVFTTAANNLAFGKISTSAILALLLFAQSVMAIVTDHFGLFGLEVRPFIKNKLIGVAIILIGIVVLSLPFEASSAMPIIVSLLAGVTISLSRVLNASLAKATSTTSSAVYNYITGLIVSLAVLFLFGQGGTVFSTVGISTNVLMHLGGLLGVGVVVLSNITMLKISSFYVALLMFLGQVLTGVLLDVAVSGTFSFTTLLGSALVALGLSINLFIDKKYA